MTLLALWLACSLMLHVRSAAGAVSVPVDLQAQLVAKISGFDRNFAARAGGAARVLVVVKPGNDESADVGALFARSVAAVGRIGGFPAQVETAEFASGAAIAERCRNDHVAIVYVSTNLEGEVGPLAAALAGADVLTVGALGSYASRGLVVGFDLEEGKPRIVVNLARARAQNVSFRAELLKLARTIGPDPIH